MQKPAMYLRQSLDKDMTRAAVDRQREDCVKLCETKGWPAPAEYCDNSVSASKGTRPEYQRLLGDIRDGRVDAVVCWDLDRLHRQPIELEEFISVADECKIALATVTGETDLSTDGGRLFARIKGAVARQEIERKSARQCRAERQRAENGLPRVAGRRMFGYELDRTPHQREARLVRKAYKDLLRGESLGSTVRAWNAKGITTVTGQPWTASALSRYLKQPAVAALRSYHGEIVADGTWKPLVPRDTWEAAYGLLMARARGIRPVRKHLLTNTAKCGVCGLGVFCKPSGGKLRYVCPDQHVTRIAEAVDALVVDTIVGRLARPDAAELLEQRERADAAKLRTEAATLRGRMENLGDDYAAGLLTGAQVKRATDKLRTELDAVERILHDAHRVRMFDGIPLGARAEVVAGKFARLDLNRRRSLIAALVSITIHTAPRGRAPFDPDLVEIRWLRED